MNDIVLGHEYKKYTIRLKKIFFFCIKYGHLLNVNFYFHDQSGDKHIILFGSLKTKNHLIYNLRVFANNTSAYRDWEITGHSNQTITADLPTGLFNDCSRGNSDIVTYKRIFLLIADIVDLIQCSDELLQTDCSCLSFMLSSLLSL